MAYGNGGVVAGVMKDPGVRTPLIAIEMDRQVKQLEELHLVISNLENRLIPILMSGASTGGVQENAPPLQVPFAASLSEQNMKLEAAGARLQSLFERIEL